MGPLRIEPGLVEQRTFFKNKKILVTGGTGMIGKYLVDLLVENGGKVRIASRDAPSRAHPQAEFLNVDLTRFDDCLKAGDGIDFVFHLAGIKGSPMMTAKKPASFFVPTLTFNTNMLEAARQCGVERYLYTSTIGVYAPTDIFREEEVWKTFPSPNDRFAGWAKRMGELQTEAYRIEYGWDKISIVRPANVYGTYDNFDPNNAMVIPSLIKRALDGEDPLVIWGDGTPIRDFIHAKDVARGMMLVLEQAPGGCFNLGSGTGVSIRQIVDLLVRRLEKKPKIVWDTTKPSGDKIRLMDISRARAIGFQPEVGLEQGIDEVMQWYCRHKNEVNKRYNVFNTDRLL